MSQSFLRSPQPLLPPQSHNCIQPPWIDTPFKVLWHTHAIIKSLLLYERMRFSKIVMHNMKLHKDFCIIIIFVTNLAPDPEPANRRVVARLIPKDVTRSWKFSGRFQTNAEFSVKLWLWFNSVAILQIEFYLYTWSVDVRILWPLKWRSPEYWGN